MRKEQMIVKGEASSESRLRKVSLWKNSLHVRNQWLGIILLFKYENVFINVSKNPLCWSCCLWIKMKMDLLMLWWSCSAAGVGLLIRIKWVCWCVEKAVVLLIKVRMGLLMVCWSSCWQSLWLYLSNWWSYELIVLLDQVWVLNSGVDIPTSEFMIMRIWKPNGIWRSGLITILYVSK